MHFECKKHQLEMSILYEKVHFKMTLICVALVKKSWYKNLKVFQICYFELEKIKHLTAFFRIF